jgi:hypothetical protein
MPDETLVIGLPFAKHTPETWLAYIQGLKALRKKSPSSKSVPEITLMVACKTGRVSLKFARNPKHATEDELHLLSAEYGIKYDDLLAIFTKRKIPVRNAQGEQTNATELKRRRRGFHEKAKASKANARDLDGPGLGEADSLDQLKQPGLTPDVPQES